ncbi:hypothetical protein TSUD_126090 [Trifolium subterraneum]|uniref:BZIP domain-containing protein n=1 Tax=Trifolium subterraneum TaxID=3900 RepID=A0A2Z6MC49_TRISU|nr:hypothetical protein TSUD_126090 [Trifolium subterraneum]
MLKFEDSICPKKLHTLSPLSNGSSAFRPWKPNLKSSLGKVEASINGGSACKGGGDKVQQKMDPMKLKRILANRVSARKSKERQNEYIANLERMTKSFQDKLSFLHPQMEAYKYEKWLLEIENHQLKLEMAIREKERILEEVEIEKKQVEKNRLLELQRKQIFEEQTKMHITRSAAKHLLSNSIA